MPDVKLYTTHCPKCKVLCAKLSEKNIKFDEITDTSVMSNLGIDQVPVLQVGDGPLMSFSDAVKYVNNLEVPNN